MEYPAEVLVGVQVPGGAVAVEGTDDRRLPVVQRLHPEHLGVERQLRRQQADL